MKIVFESNNQSYEVNGFDTALFTVNAHRRGAMNIFKRFYGEMLSGTISSGLSEFLIANAEWQISVKAFDDENQIVSSFDDLSVDRMESNINTGRFVVELEKVIEL